MSYIAPPAAHGNSIVDTPAARDELLAGLRAAAARAKLEASLFESVSISLRQKAIDCAGARERLRGEGLLDRLPCGGGR